MQQEDCLGATAWGAIVTSPGYAYVHESIAEQFVAECKKAMVELYGTDPRADLRLLPIISPKATERLAGLIDPEEGRHRRGSDPEARYLDPTVIYPVTWRSSHGDDLRTASPNPHLPGHGRCHPRVKKQSEALSGFPVQSRPKGNRSLLAILSFGAVRSISEHSPVYRNHAFGGSDIPASVTTMEGRL